MKSKFQEVLAIFTISFFLVGLSPKSQLKKDEGIYMCLADASSEMYSGKCLEAIYTRLNSLENKHRRCPGIHTESNVVEETQNYASIIREISTSSLSTDYDEIKEVDNSFYHLSRAGLNSNQRMPIPLKRKLVIPKKTKFSFCESSTPTSEDIPEECYEDSCASSFDGSCYMKIWQIKKYAKILSIDIEKIYQNRNEMTDEYKKLFDGLFSQKKSCIKKIESAKITKKGLLDVTRNLLSVWYEMLVFFSLNAKETSKRQREYTSQYLMDCITLMLEDFFLMKKFEKKKFQKFLSETRLDIFKRLSFNEDLVSEKRDLLLRDLKLPFFSKHKKNLKKNRRKLKKFFSKDKNFNLNRDSESNFEDLPRSSSFQSNEYAKYSLNYTKNRYTNQVTFPTDSKRVILRNEAPYDDYINASNVFDKELVVAESPLENTVKHFWQMIFEQKIRNLNFLGEKLHGQNLACAQYWPSRIGKVVKFGKYRVKLISEKKTNNGHTTIRELKVSKGFMFLGRKVTQFQYSNLENECFPMEEKSFFEHFELTRKKKGKFLIHSENTCNASAIVVFFSKCIDRWKNQQSIEFSQILLEMRESYNFFNDAIVYKFAISLVKEYLKVKHENLNIQIDSNFEQHILRKFKKRLGVLGGKKNIDWREAFCQRNKYLFNDLLISCESQREIRPLPLDELVYVFDAFGNKIVDAQRDGLKWFCDGYPSDEFIEILKNPFNQIVYEFRGKDFSSKEEKISPLLQYVQHFVDLKAEGSA